MSSKEDIEKLLYYLSRRLQKLKEVQALHGASTEPQILIEIEDTEAIIKKLQDDLIATRVLEEKIQKLERELENKDAKEVNSLSPKRWWEKSWLLGLVVLLSLLVGISIGVFSLGKLISTLTAPLVAPDQSPPAISLAGLRYKTSDWNQRLVDLRTVASSGIPIKAGQSLQFRDLLAFAPEDSSGYRLQAEVYIGGTNELIGKTETVPLHSGIVQVGDVAIKAYNHGGNPSYWQVQEDWTDLLIAFVVYPPNGQPTVPTRIKIRLDPNGTAWLFEPPNFSLASLVYRINDGPNQVLDLRYAGEAGIEVQPGEGGDELSILEVWYYANARGGSLSAEFQLDQDGSGLVDDDPFHKTDKVEIKQGINKITGSEVTWKEISEDRQYLMVKLVRGDSTIVQELAIPFRSPGGPGLIPYSEIEQWNSKVIDFETLTEVSEWSNTEFSSIAQSDEYAFTGQSALAVRTTATSSALFAKRTRDFTADMIVGQVYWPTQDGVDIEWVQVCVREEGKCASIPMNMGQWNTFVFNLAQKTYDGEPLNTRGLEELLLQGKINGVSEDKPYTFYVDSIQIYNAKQP